MPIGSSTARCSRSIDGRDPPAIDGRDPPGIGLVSIAHIHRLGEIPKLVGAATQACDNRAVDPRLETIATDLAFGESPRWHDGRIWFCDWIDGDVRSVTPDGADPKIHAHLDGFPICIDWDLDDNLLVVDGANRRILRGIDHELELLVDLSPLSDRPWNEIATHPSGRFYVNGIGYDLMAGEAAATGQIAVVEPDGAVRLVAHDLDFPNGMAIGADGSTLVVAESHGARIAAFTVDASGDLVDRRVFAEIEGSAPDGLSFADDGTLWYADVPNRHCQRLAEDGTIIDTVQADRGCFSCAVSPDGDLYVTATGWDDDTFSRGGGSSQAGSSRGGVLYRVPASAPRQHEEQG